MKKKLNNAALFYIILSMKEFLDSDLVVRHSLTRIWTLVYHFKYSNKSETFLIVDTSHLGPYAKKGTYLR